MPDGSEIEMPVSETSRQVFLAAIVSGSSARKACRDHSIDRSLIYDDLIVDAVFASQYARACAIRADEMFDETLEIADDARNDWMEAQGGDAPLGWRENGDSVNRTRVRIDVRKWALGKMNPRKYGEKFAIGGSDDLPAIKTQDVTDVARRVAFVLASAVEAKNGNAG